MVSLTELRRMCAYLIWEAPSPQGGLAHDSSIHPTDLNQEKNTLFSQQVINRWRRKKKEKKCSLLLICGLQFKLRSWTHNSRIPSSALQQTHSASITVKSSPEVPGEGKLQSNPQANSGCQRGFIGTAILIYLYSLNPQPAGTSFTRPHSNTWLLLMTLPKSHRPPGLPDSPCHRYHELQKR